jgi:hypothetical protein
MPQVAKLISMQTVEIVADLQVGLRWARIIISQVVKVLSPRWTVVVVADFQLGLGWVRIKISPVAKVTSRLTAVAAADNQLE